MNKGHWLNIVEYMAIATSVGGTIATIITQEIALTATPLTLALMLNTINRQRQFKAIYRLPEHHKLIEIYDALISANDEYRFHQLEIQEQLRPIYQHIQDLEQQINNSNIDLKNCQFQKTEIQKQINLICQKIENAKNQNIQFNSDALSHICLSLSQRLKQLEQLQLKSPRLTQADENLSFVLIQKNQKHELDELDLAKLKSIISYLEKMPDKIRHYHRDHKASLEEAEVVAKYYFKGSDLARKVRTIQDLRELIDFVDNLKDKVSQYKHESYKYRWSTGLEKEVITELRKMIN